MSSSSSAWLYSYIKLRFFSRIGRLLRSKASSKLCSPPLDQFHASKLTKVITYTNGVEVEHVKDEQDNRSRSNSSTSSSRNGSDIGGEEIMHDLEAVPLQRAVKRLHFGSSEEKELAAKEIEKLAKEDLKVKKLMVELEVIPALVAMVASEVAVGWCHAAARALVEIADGSSTNKAIMVEAGILSKLPKNIQVIDESTKHEFAALLLSLSTLPNTQFSSFSPQIVIPFIVQILENSTSSFETKDLCLSTLVNFSKGLENARTLISNGHVLDTLSKLCSSKEYSEKILAILENLVATKMGRKYLEDNPLLSKRLIDCLSWEEKPKCQEISAHILMVLANQSVEQRAQLAGFGIVHVLLEVALLGSPLAQKRALKLLQLFKGERSVRMGPHSGPQVSGRMITISLSGNSSKEAQEGKKKMKALVRQSLDKNMEMITRRASAGDSSNVKALVLSTSSKSLPY